MFESYETIVQIAILAVCAGIALYRAAVFRSRTWTLVFFYFGSIALGDLYWLVCLIFYGETPQIAVVSNLSWYACYTFLYLLINRKASPEEGNKRRFLPFLMPVFTAAMAVYYMQWGSILTNLIYAAMMGLLLFAAVQRLMDGQRYRKQRFLLVWVLVFCLLEYALWTSSCIWEYTVTSPYYWFDVLLTVIHPFLIPAVKKAVTT